MRQTTRTDAKLTNHSKRGSGRGSRRGRVHTHSNETRPEGINNTGHSEQGVAFLFQRRQLLTQCPRLLVHLCYPLAHLRGRVRMSLCSVFVCVSVRCSDASLSLSLSLSLRVCVCLCERARARVSVCVRERESVCACVRACACT